MFCAMLKALQNVVNVLYIGALECPGSTWVFQPQKSAGAFYYGSLHSRVVL